MAMPDAVRALLTLATASPKRLRRPVYNVTSFSLTAAEIRQLVLKIFPNAAIRFVTDIKRQEIVDSWPANLDDSAAREEWGWTAGLDADKAFRDYLAPNIRRRYQVSN
jgi:threonine 3-dehydrogenase